MGWGDGPPCKRAARALEPIVRENVGRSPLVRGRAAAEHDRDAPLRDVRA
jgi:hypothetical protein